MDGENHRCALLSRAIYARAQQTYFRLANAHLTPEDLRMTSKQIKDLMTRLGVKRAGLATLTGADIRTVDGWLSDQPKRRPSSIAKKVLEMLSKP